MNSIIEDLSRQTAHHQKTLNLQVRYIGARRPFVEPNAAGGVTLGEIKPAVLDFFNLQEGSANGGTKVYEFSLNSKVLPNQNALLELLADGKHELKLELIERFEQG